jgi:hypothetical protein
MSASCSRGTDEEQIRALIAAAEIAAEARDVSDLMALVADDYADGRGLNKAELQKLLRAYFLVHPKIELLVKIGDIELETANRARVQVDMAMLGTRMGGGPERTSLTGDVETLQVELRRIDSKWLVTRADRARR